MSLQNLYLGLLGLICFGTKLIQNSEACFFRAKPDNSKVAELGTSVLKNFTRKISNASCICGRSGNAKTDSKWILYIHFNISTERQRVCTGTVINSNMIITSHQCLMKSNKMEVYDTWDNSGNLAKKEDLKISTDLKLTSSSIFFNLSQIIYRARYAMDMKKGLKAPQSDVVILVFKDLQEDFTFTNTSLQVWPICLPQYLHIPTSKMLNKEARYEGVRGWDDHAGKYRTDLNFTVYIQLAERCNKLRKMDVKTSDNTLCLKHSEPGPTIEGGPLRLTVNRYIEGQDDRNFLVGIASWVDRSLQNGNQKYAYFTNINSIVKYIEEQAEMHGSTWCETPNFFDDYWPWETFTKQQDESLNCDCGRKPNLPATLGRIIGGQNATPHEFPWMVQLQVAKGLNFKTRSIDRELCGASIINDKVILSAAHCFVKLGLRRKNGPGFNVIELRNWPSQHLIFVRKHGQFYDDSDDVRVKAEKVVIHPGYPEEKEGGRTDFDLALLILQESLAPNFTTLGSGNPDLVPICLPREGHYQMALKRGLNAVLSGWGRNISTKEEQRYNNEHQEKLPFLQTFPTVLQKITMPIHSIFNCTTLDAQQIGPIKNYPSDTRICAGSFDSRHDAFTGDSGGPLVVETMPGRWVQIGVVSYTTHYTNFTTSDFNASTYYGNVEGFLNFINYYSHEAGAKGCKQLKY